MQLPPPLQLESEEEYRQHYLDTLVNGDPVITPDGTRIEFFEDRWKHAFYQSSDKWKDDKDVFSWSRAKRMDWIRALLTDQTVDVFKESGLRGYNRLFLYRSESYLVITKEKRQGLDVFVTAYVCSSGKMNKILKLERWK